VNHTHTTLFAINGSNNKIITGRKYKLFRYVVYEVTYKYKRKRQPVMQ